MTPHESVAAMAARLSAVDWQRHGDKCWSKAALLREYFRRAAHWAAAYQCDAPIPFFDIAHCVSPGARADQHVVSDVMEKVKAGGGGAVAHIVPYILHWGALRATREIVLPADLEDPFEPLVLLFERDGGFHTANGFVELEYLAVRMQGWRAQADKPPMASFAPEALDEIDRAGSLAQFGYVIGPDGEPAGHQPE
jgi:hypothetical protein